MTLGIKSLVVIGVAISLLMGAAYIRHVIAENALSKEIISRMKEERAALDIAMEKNHKASEELQNKYTILRGEFRSINAQMDKHITNDPCASCVFSAGSLRSIDEAISASSR